ncbi:thioredoxin domain-containing protein [Zhouia spongiae]|uniref:Thioredoxin domain-containing protein n=1 Tax=Zhouia spongiae TaxID=2202721 RepID=A0ABY3YKT2_9FLAO|nr:thioredoxin domain-containing protein [Zhouia spongiae]UNY98445.1 thioredoxin domain-containing protein [Zhouia spongiae]
MKKILFFISVCLFSLSCKQKQEEKKVTYNAIHFSEGSFQQVLDKGTAEDKLIFVDCYTSWCAPCKWMEKHVFVKEDVYTFYNDNFVNYKIDMEKGEGPELAKRYQVTSFPTYLFIDGKGELVHLAKSRMEADEFIKEAQKALNPENAFGNLVKKYESGKMDMDELTSYAVQLNKFRDPKANEILVRVIEKSDDQFLRSASGWKLIQSFTYDDDSELFQFLDQNRSHFEKNFGKDAVNAVYRRAVQRNMYQYSRNNEKELFFESIDSLKRLNAGTRDIAIPHCQFYLQNLDVEAYIKTSDYYVNEQLQNDHETIAFIARSVLNYHKDNDQLMAQAAKLIKKAYAMAPDNYGIVSTYAQILGHTGEKEEAIKAGEKAVAMADTISSKVKKRAEQNLEEIKGLH